MSSVSAQFRSPSNAQFADRNLFLVSGSSIDGVLEGTIEIPAFSETGTWRLTSFFVSDAVNNSREYKTADLVALGFPTELEVVIADIEVAPIALSFGDVSVGLSATQVVTITNEGSANLYISTIGFKNDPAGVVTISSAPTLPATLLPDSTIDVEITFNPSAPGSVTAILQVLSNDPDQPVVEVLMAGAGVLADPSDSLGAILTYFDRSVAAGELVGSGPGASGTKRLAALRNMLEASGDLIDAEQVQQACNQLLDAYLRTDGLFHPPRLRSGVCGSRGRDSDPSAAHIDGV